MGRRATLNGLLGLIVAFLAVEIARTWAPVLSPVDPAGKVSARAVAPEKHENGKRGVDEATAKAEAALPILVAAIEAKDLFDPSRQKAPVEEVEVAPPPPKETGPPPGVAIVGFSLFGSDREAFVTDSSHTQGRQQRRLRIGDQLSGYSVKRIEATSMVLTSPSGDEVTMPLVIEKGAQPAAGVIQGTSPAAGIQPPKPPQVVAADSSHGQEIAIQRPQGQVHPAAPVPGIVPEQGEPPIPLAEPPDIRNRLERLREHQAVARMGRNKR